MKDMALVVGNGLSISLCQSLRSSINTSLPLDLNFVVRQKTPTFAKGAFPQLFEAWKGFSAQGKTDHFDFFRLIKRESAASTDLGAEFQTEVEARHFLALAYSHVSLQLKPTSSWDWARFFKEEAKRLKIAISFNYDRILENSLSLANIQFATNSVESGKTILFKPHGSCEMDCNPQAISVPNLGYPLMNWLNRNNYEAFYLGSSNLMQPRQEAFTILPHEKNLYQEFQWQKGIWKNLAAHLAGVKHCLLVGHSYGEADQSEINRIIENLPAGATIYHCNRRRASEDLLRKVEFCGQRLLHFEGPPVFT